MDGGSSNEARRDALRNGGRVAVAAVAMVVAMLIFRMSYRLTNVSRNVYEVDGLEHMVVVYGMVVVVFGMVYFIYGLTIVIELGLELFGWVHGNDVDDCNNQGNQQKTPYKLCIQATATVVSMSMLGWAIYHGCNLAATSPEGGIRNCMVFVIGFTGMAIGFICFMFGIPFVAEPALSLYDQFMQRDTQCHVIYQEKITDPLLVV